jgi:hypothetical protein
VGSYLGVGTTPRAVFQPRALAEAATYLDGQGENVVVLTCEDLGNLLAGEIRGRVVLGHAGATLDVERRREAIPKFFAGALSPEEQAALVQRYGASHILTADVETLECGPNFAPGPAWSLKFDREGIKIYARNR